MYYTVKSIKSHTLHTLHKIIPIVTAGVLVISIPVTTFADEVAEIQAYNENLNEGDLPTEWNSFYPWYMVTYPNSPEEPQHEYQTGSKYKEGGIYPIVDAKRLPTTYTVLPVFNKTIALQETIQQNHYVVQSIGQSSTSLTYKYKRTEAVHPPQKQYTVVKDYNIIFDEVLNKYSYKDTGKTSNRNMIKKSEDTSSNTGFWYCAWEGNINRLIDYQYESEIIENGYKLDDIAGLSLVCREANTSLTNISSMHWAITTTEVGTTETGYVDYYPLYIGSFEKRYIGTTLFWHSIIDQTIIDLVKDPQGVTAWTTGNKSTLEQADIKWIQTSNLQLQIFYKCDKNIFPCPVISYAPFVTTNNIKVNLPSADIPTGNVLTSIINPIFDNLIAIPFIALAVTLCPAIWVIKRFI